MLIINFFICQNRGTVLHVLLLLVSGLKSICLTCLLLPSLKPVALKIAASTKSVSRIAYQLLYVTQHPALALASIRLTPEGVECGPGELYPAFLWG